jgi:FkbM family methyltransferase
MFGIQWLIKRLLDGNFRRELRHTLASPWRFYLIAAMKLLSGPSGRPMELRLHDGKTVLIPQFMSLYIFDEIFIRRVYDTGAAIRPRTIIDIGANTGMFVTRAKQLWPDCTIIAYEPEPANYATLSETIRRNGFSNVIPVNAAVMAKEGEVTLYRHPRNIGGHSTVHSHGADSVKVPAESLDQALGRLPEGRADLIKLDCEGAEGEIFKGLTADLTGRIAAIVYEPDAQAYSVTQVNAVLRAFGYHVAYQHGLVMAAKAPP